MEVTHNLITPALGAVETRKTIMRFRFEVRSRLSAKAEETRADQPERPFKGRQHSGEVISRQCVSISRWRDLHPSELLGECGLLCRCQLCLGVGSGIWAELNKRYRPHLKVTNKTKPIDETLER